MAATGLVIVAPTASAAVQPPAKDPLYTYSSNLSRIAPGTVLKERSITVEGLLAATEPVSAIQLLFRTTDQIGRPAVAVTTAIQPLSVAACVRLAHRAAAASASRLRPLRSS